LPFQAVLFVTALTTLIFVLLQRSGGDLVHLTRENPVLFWKLFLANAVQSGLGTSLSIIGIALTDAINAGFLVKLSTVTTTLFAWLFLKEKMSWLKAIVIVAMLSGAYLLTTKGQTLYPQVGDLYILGACVWWSLGNVFVRKILQTQSINPDVVTLQKPAAGLPVYLGLVAISVFFPEWLGGLSQVLTWGKISLNILPYALTSGICLGLAWIFLYRTLKVSTASYMTLMSMVTPVIVSALAIGILGEVLVWVQVIGAGMILLSGMMISFSDIVKV